jgi:hypothetical protein
MKAILLAIFSMSLSLSLGSAATAWKLERNKDGIKVWTRKPENSTLKEYRATAVLSTTIDKLVAFFKDYSKFDQWMYKVDEGSVRLVKKVNDDDYYIQMIMSAPLIKSRESITHFVFKNPDNKGIVFITLDAAPDILPANDKYVRIPQMKGYWKFVPVGNNKVEVTHQAITSAGGTLPETLANLGIVDAPFSMLEKLKEMLK